MEESEFNDLVDNTLLAIEDTIEDCGVEIDTENVSGILTLVFENETEIIINRQTPMRQIWVATRSGGYHLDYDQEKERWYQDGIELYSLLSRECSEQAGTELTLGDV